MIPCISTFRLLNRITDKVNSIVVDRVIRRTLSTMPGMWAFVRDDRNDKRNQGGTGWFRPKSKDDLKKALEGRASSRPQHPANSRNVEVPTRFEKNPYAIAKSPHSLENSLVRLSKFACMTFRPSGTGVSTEVLQEIFNAHAHASRNAYTQIKNLLYHLCLVA